MQHPRFSPRAKARPRIPLSQLFMFSLLTIGSPLAALAQNQQYTKNSPDQTLRSDARIDPATHALSIQIPLGAYPGRAGLNLPVSITYSSKSMRLEANGDFQPQHGATYSLYVATNDERSIAGWSTSLAPARIEAAAEGYDGYFGVNVGQPGGLEHYIQYISRMRVIMGDGSSHELRRDDVPRIGASPNTPFYAIDGSQLRFESDSNTLLLPDGSRYIFNGGQANQYLDRNGNKLNYDGQWVDTVGRTFNSPLTVNTVGDHQYNLPGLGGGSLTYTFRWRYLRDPQTNETVLTDPNQELYYPGNYNCDVYNNGFQTVSPSLFSSSNPQNPICASSRYNPVVLSEILLPNGESYRFTYDVWGEVDKFYLPDGAYERYQYAQILPMSFMKQPFGVTNRAVIDRWVSSDGAAGSEVHWQYGVDFTAFNANPYITTMTAPDGTVTKSYLHSQPDPYDGNVSHSTPYGFDDTRSGRAYDDRVYSPSGQLLRRNLTEWTVSGPTSGGYSGATRNPRVARQVEIILDTGGTALAKTTVHNYDLSFEFSIGPIETSVNEYDWVAVDQTNAQTAAISFFVLGTLLRTQETTNLLLDSTLSQTLRDAYRERNLLGLTTSTRVRDGDNNIVTQSTLSYDQTSLMNPGSVASWIDPQTAYRGNPTTMSRWLNTTSTYLQTLTSFDQFGNVRTMTDAKGNQSSVDYSSTYQYALPTTTTTAMPDPSGIYGSNVAFSTTTNYDLSTGRVVSTTDANNSTVTAEYNDPLNRPTRTVRAAGSAAQNQGPIIYDDANHLLTGKSDLTTFNDSGLKAETRYDGLGRTFEARQYEGGTNYITVQTQYDAMGRPYKVSNPFRPWKSENPAWTTSSFDALGRVISITTPDGAQVTTAYAATTSGALGTTVLVTDQSGKQRLSKSDALGHLTDIWEITTPDSATENISFPGHAEVTAGYHTSYKYDVAGNLHQVTQGAQQRFFLYDSLSRLIRARNPEQNVNANLSPSLTDPITQNNQWAMAYTYDANGNLATRTDARGLVSTYAYDALNRNITVTYSNDPAQTPTVNRYYDGRRDGVTSNVPNSKGRLWQTETSGDDTGSRTTVDGFDAMGRPLTQRQQFRSGGTWSQSYSVSRTYNLAGHVLSQTYPSSHTVNYVYDEAGRLTSFTGNLGEGVMRTYANEFQYMASGAVQQEKFGTDTPLYHKQRANERGQVWDMRLSTVPFGTDPANGDRGALVNYYSNSFAQGGSGADNNGNLLRQETYIPGSSYFQDDFSYDKLNRLTSTSEKLNGLGANTFTQAYQFDRWGNRTIDQALTTANVPHPAYTANPSNNRLNAPAGYAPQIYDYAGNLTQDSTSQISDSILVYDAENRLCQITPPDPPPCDGWFCPEAPLAALPTQYIYDGDGHRVRRLFAGPNHNITWQVYGFDGELLAEYPQYDAAVVMAQPQKEYGYRNGQLLVTAEPYINVALNKPATQSTTFSTTSTADKAVNGDANGRFSSGSASATNYGLNSWWQVDLQSVQNINSITVWGRTDCCHEMSTDFYVFVSNSPFTSTDLNTTLNQSGVSNYHYTDYAGPASLGINRTGRYVRVQI
ncbi:MAG: repeat-associated core domain protein, partial [Acidobacteria bacterium]|nr:repeat-associated core domain protein [Acidobacteriota bacterium]